VNSRTAGAPGSVRLPQLLAHAAISAELALIVGVLA